MALDVRHADALQVMRGALQVPAFFAIQLQERAGVLLHRFIGRYLAQELSYFGFDATIAADVDLEAGVHADDANVFDAGFSTVTRTTRYRQLDLVWRVHIEQHLF